MHFFVSPLRLFKNGTSFDDKGYYMAWFSSYKVHFAHRPQTVKLKIVKPWQLGGKENRGGPRTLINDPGQYVYLDFLGAYIL